MSGLDAIYDQQGWSLVRRYAVRQWCPFCHQVSGQGCARLRPSGRHNNVVTMTGVHASRVALASHCDEHGAEAGQACTDDTMLCEARILLAGELISNEPSLRAA